MYTDCAISVVLTHDHCSYAIHSDQEVLSLALEMYHYYFNTVILSSLNYSHASN